MQTLEACAASEGGMEVLAHAVQNFFWRTANVLGSRGRDCHVHTNGSRSALTDQRSTWSNGDLSGRVAIITAASKGLGAAIAQKLAGDDAAVAVNFSNSAREAEIVVANIQEREGRALAVRADVSKLAEVKKLFEATVRGCRLLACPVFLV